MPQPASGPRIAGVANGSILGLPGLAAFFPEFDRFQRLSPLTERGLTATIGWGHKPTALRARRVAQRRDIPYVAAEDGFLRSWGPARLGYAPLSLAVDYTGIYYDARRPSGLEDLIRDQPVTGAERQRARHCMAQLRRHRLSKYNHTGDRPVTPCDGRRRVLVVDQTRGDASIAGGRANAATFARMLETALADNPDAEIIVKTHPDVVAGEKGGHLAGAERHPRCRVVAEAINPWALLDAVDTVHVVTSQLGFEALIAGKGVVCHGVPFYAGWGLTTDHLDTPRRQASRSLEAVFAAAYLHYCRYVNPYTGQPSSLEATIDLLADQAHQQRRLTGKWRTVGLSWHKRRFAGDFLGTLSRVRHSRSATNAQRVHDLEERLLVWSADAHRPGGPAIAGTAPWRMEDGFLRSVGLGVDLVQPLSVVIDSQGIYYDPSGPSDLEELLNHASFDDRTLSRARALRDALVQRGLSKYNVTDHPLGPTPPDRRIILVPGQVESDASIQHGAATLRTNEALLTAVRAAHPEAFVIYKPHPDVVAGSRPGQLSDASPHLYDRLATHVGITDALARAHEVHTLTSLAGFEGLLRGSQVVTYGLPFYAGWGLTQDQVACPRRTATRSLDELVAATLIRYAVYRDPRSRQICNAETAMELIAQQRAAGGARPGLLGRGYRLYRRLTRAWQT
mgnify:CR=1 FL=1